ncbi:MAG: NIPSNAP family protein [Gammaproteobacteria bacterium]
MIIDHRTYTFRPGTLKQWLNKYETEGLPLQKKHLGEFLGLFTTEVGNLHQVVFLWGYEDMADRERRRAKMEADPEWQKFIEEIWALQIIQTQEIKLLRSAKFSPIK